MGGIPTSIEELFYGSATLGERGQVVIPADARKDCDIHAGDKLLVFRHPIYPQMLILAKVGKMQQILQQLTNALGKVSNRLANEAELPTEAEG